MELKHEINKSFFIVKGDEVRRFLTTSMINDNHIDAIVENFTKYGGLIQYNF